MDASSCVLIDEETYLRIYMNHLGWPITAKETFVVTNGGIDLTANERVKFIQGDAVDVYKRQATHIIIVLPVPTSCQQIPPPFCLIIQISGKAAGSRKEN